MTFPEILNAVYKQYNLNYCQVADSLNLDDDIVLGWEKGTIIPTEKQLQLFSDAYIIPIGLLKKSLKRK